MSPYDIRSKAQWDELLDSFGREVRMTACLTDAAGTALQCCGERYPLCAAIRRNDSATSFICSQASAAMTAVVAKTLRPEIDICDVGLLRLVVPLVRDGTLVGQITACGLATPDEELDPFLVAKQLDVAEERVVELAKSTPQGSEEDLLPAVERLFAQLHPDESAAKQNGGAP